MKIRHLSVKNFRGIENLDWCIPDTNVVALIGRGDTTKSSILDSIRYALFPSWNPSFNEFDFFNGETSNPIEITVTVGELPSNITSDAKFGLFLRGWNRKDSLLVDEPGEELEEVLSICLTVNDDLKPSWRVVCDRQEEGPSFGESDRAKANAAFIGATYADKHLTWSKYSALSRITETENISASLTLAARAAKDALNDKRENSLVNFDSAAKKVEQIAKTFGVPVSETGAYKAQLDTGSVNVQLGGLSLHDENLPLRCLGLGSRRMLIIGIQQENLDEPHITLIDEIEIGLEPHRISRLLKLLKQDSTGQYFITTHSPVVLRELIVDELGVVQSKNGVSTITNAALPNLKESIQGKLRSGAEAFLSKKVIVCEGATEVGLCRGLDNYRVGQAKDSFSFHGIAMFDAGGGSKVRPTAVEMKKLGYDVAVIVDTDDHFLQADEQELVELGVCVIKWDGGLAVEEYMFQKLPWNYIISSVNLATDIHGDGVVNQINQKHQGELAESIEDWQDSVELRQAIGKASLGNSEGKNAWFKRQSWAEEWFSALAGSLDDLELDPSKKIRKLENWIVGDA